MAKPRRTYRQSCRINVGDILKIRPVIDVDEGVLKVIGKVRGDKKALSIIQGRLEELLSEYRDQKVGIAIVDEETCRPLTNRMEAIARRGKGSQNSRKLQIGTVLAAHLGVTGTGIYFWDKGSNQIIRESGITCGGEIPDFAQCK